MAYLHLFPEERVALAKEVRHHPALQKRIADSGLGVSDFPGMVAEICTFCGIVVDGDYLPEQLDKMCGILVVELKAIRSIIVS